MSRSSKKTRHSRSIRFESLQARELMAADALMMAKLTAEQWAERILNNYENLQLGAPIVPQLSDMKKFASEQEAQKFLTDSLLKTWQEVLGKPVNDKLAASYWSRYWMSDAFTRSSSDSIGIAQSALPIETVMAANNSTNNQVRSVDEADQFEVSASGYVYSAVAGDNSVFRQVKIIDAHDPKNLRTVATIDVDGFNAKMHLVGDQLILVSSGYIPEKQENVSHIQVYGVSDPSKPTLQTKMTVMSGAMQQSRFADGKLTLFGNQTISALRPLFMADDPTAVYTTLTDTPIGRFETVEEYTTRIQPLVVGWMLPDIKVEGSEVDAGDWKDLVASPNSDYHRVVSVLSFDLTESGLELIDSETLIGASMTTNYVDENTVYIAQPVWVASTLPDTTNILQQKTEIYSIEFNSDNVHFVASGAIPGTIRDSRMMDEYKGNLRVFSDVRNWSLVPNQTTADLYILRPDAGKLEIIGQLTDVADGQVLYSSYFDEDQALITTWVSEIPNLWNMPAGDDPLHGFDLSDPTKPVELSELVIPGVSTYLQRVDATHLVGLGYIDVGTSDYRPQVSLYDVSDLTNLKVVDTWTSSLPSMLSINFRGWNQDALAINFDPTSGLFSIASSAFGSFISSGLTVFKIDAGDKDPLRFLGSVGEENTALRSTVVGDTLLMVSNVWLHAFSINDLSNEIDRELLTTPGVADWIQVAAKGTLEANLLANDRVADGRITAISSSSVGKVTILDDGATIRYEANDIVGGGGGEQLTYTVTRENGEKYSSTVYVNFYNLTYPPTVIGIDPFIIEPSFPIAKLPIASLPISPTIIEKIVAIEGDINGDGELAPQDILLLVDYLNQRSEQRVAGEALVAISASFTSMDLSGDGEFSPIDIMLAVERLNANAAALLSSGEAPDDAIARQFINESNVNDEELVSLLASNLADQDEILRRAKKSSL